MTDGTSSLLHLSYYTVLLAVKGSPSGGPFVVGVGAGKMNQYWSLSEPVLVHLIDQYWFALRPVLVDISNQYCFDW